MDFDEKPLHCNALVMTSQSIITPPALLSMTPRGCMGTWQGSRRPCCLG